MNMGKEEVREGIRLDAASGPESHYVPISPCARQTHEGSNSTRESEKASQGDCGDDTRGIPESAREMAGAHLVMANSSAEGDYG